MSFCREGKNSRVPFVLEQFDVTQRFENSHYQVDYVGLAQHYGLKTDVLDVTNSIEVAMFFAMCDYDSDTDSYKPKHEDKQYVGYLYAIWQMRIVMIRTIPLVSTPIN